MVPMTLLVAAVLGMGADLEDGVLDFTAPWCGPCQQISPMVSRLKRQGFPIRKIDCDSKRDLVHRFNVTTIPAFILVIDGVERGRLGGGASEDDLKRLCARVPRKNDSAAAAGVSEKDPHANSRLDGPREEVAPLAATQSSPEKSGVKFPLLAVKKDNSPVRDLHEGAVSRGKADERTNGRAPLQGNPLAASVRIRVKDGHQADSVGSGTIIDSRVGKTTILTCGHIFRNRDKQADIEVDCFSGGRQQKFVGRRVFHDLDSDVGLITINADSLASCRVAAAGTRIVKGAPVISVGCSEGDKPTVQRVKITALNRYQGADNIEVAGMPVEGRSGGGLFTQAGQLIGVCSGADSHYREGFFAGLQSVHDLLDRCRLTHLDDSGSAGENQDPLAGIELVDAVDGVPSVADSSDDVTLATAPLQKPAAQRPAAKAPARTRLTAMTDAAGGSSNDGSIREALEQAGEAEIVCIIRQPGAASRVVILNRASRRFVEYLSDEMDDRPDIHETTLKAHEEKSLPRKPAATQKVRRPATEPQAYRRQPANRPERE